MIKIEKLHKVFGKNEVRTYMERICALPSFSLTWTANGMDVSDAGDVGYVYGLYKWGYVDSLGIELEYMDLPYITFWRKQINGEWNVVLEADY